MLKWQIDNDEADFKNACKAYERALLLDITPLGFAEIYWERGKLFSDHEMYNEAVQDLESSLTYSYNYPAVIALIECYCQLDRITDAEASLNGIKDVHLPDEYQLEYLQAKAVLAIKKKDIVIARKITEELKQLKLRELYFQRTRDKLCLNLLMSIEEGRASDSLGILKSLGKLFRGLSSTLQYLELKPNIFGLGINVNKILGQCENARMEEKSEK